MVLQIRHPIGIVRAVGTLEPVLLLVFSIVSVVTVIVIGIGIAFGIIGTWSWCDGQENASSSGGC